MERTLPACFALTVVALFGFSSGASATDLTSPTGTVATPTIKLESEGHVTLDLRQVGQLVAGECLWKLEGNVETDGEGKPSVIPLSGLTINSCTKWNYHVTAVTPGKLEFAWTSGYDGTVTWSGATIEATRFGIICRYKAENTHLGTVTGGTPATVDIAANLAFHSGGAVCSPNEAPYPITGSLVVASPESLFVDRSGTTITSPTGTTATPTIKAESEGHVGIDHPLATIQCEWAFEGTVESHEGNAVIPLSSMTTSGCTDSWHATTVSAGKLEINSTSGYNGTVRWSGATVELTRLGTSCRFKSENTDLGAITGGSPATIDLEGQLLPDGGSPLCGEEAYPLTGSLKVASPGSLFVDRAG